MSRPLILRLKSWMVTWMFVVAEELELALVPVTATMNTGTAMGQVTDNTRPVNEPTLAGQFTDKTAPLKEPVRPDGKTKPGPVVHATLPENPLIALNVHVEAPGKVVIGGHDGAKSTTWKVTEFEVTLCVPAAPVTLAR